MTENREELIQKYISLEKEISQYKLWANIVVVQREVSAPPLHHPPIENAAVLSAF